MIAWLLISFFVLLFLGVPIAMSLGLSAMGGILFLGGGSTVTIAQRMFEGMNSFALLAIPLYTFAGFTMSKGGISKRLMDFCYSIVGHIYGGLAHVNVLSSMIFAGISGSAVADTAGVSGHKENGRCLDCYWLQQTAFPPPSASSFLRPSPWWLLLVSAAFPPVSCSSAALSPASCAVWHR